MWCPKEQDAPNRTEYGAVNMISFFVHNCHHLAHKVSLTAGGLGHDANLLDNKPSKAVSDEDERHRIACILNER